MRECAEGGGAKDRMRGARLMGRGKATPQEPITAKDHDGEGHNHGDEARMQGKVHRSVAVGTAPLIQRGSLPRFIQRELQRRIRTQHAGCSNGVSSSLVLDAQGVSLLRQRQCTRAVLVCVRIPVDRGHGSRVDAISIRTSNWVVVSIGCAECRNRDTRWRYGERSVVPREGDGVARSNFVEGWVASLRWLGHDDATGSGGLGD